MFGVCCFQGQAYSDPGATAYDAVDGVIPTVIVTGFATINAMLVSFLLAPTTP